MSSSTLSNMTYYPSREGDKRSAASRKRQFLQQSSGGGTGSTSQLTQQSSHSSNGGRTGSSSGDLDMIRHKIYIPPSVGKREEANVLRARALVALILLLAATGVATGANVLVKQQERRDFENQFAAYAKEIVTVSRSKANLLFDALDSFASSIGAQAAAEHAFHNTSWPFYRIPSWSVQAKKLADLTGVDDPTIAVAPIVQEGERDQWNSFAAQQNPIWYQESIDNEEYKEFTVEQLLQKTIPFIHFYDPENSNRPTPVSGPGEVYPYFQAYPIGLNPGMSAMRTNINILNSSQRTEELFTITKKTRRPTIGFTQLRIDRGKSILGSQIVQPIYDGPDTEAEDRKIVAITAISLHWLDYFKNVLSDGEDGLVVVLESACPRLFEGEDWQDLPDSQRNIITYQVDGSEVVLLGEADLHDPEYDALVVSETFLDLDIDQSQLPEGSCIPALTLHVYPSAELENSFQTDNATIYTVAVVAIFAFTTLIFLLYDFSVGKRQRAVMDRIAKQDRIVSDIFPTAFRDRLYENNTKIMVTGDAELLDEDGLIGLDETFTGRSNSMGSDPLADLFPSVTVVFADLVGFTAWSSAREPHQVFILLETIYGAFDKLAYRHSVFKVETVGDCYVAAAGLPEPTDDHAVVACRFARDCLKKMKDATLRLEVALGPDTSDLDLRTGIHSGQVTAGVLRGQRSRFQLFGDTMNTAARMESSSGRGRIQVSQVTADLLTEAGLSGWIIPRSTKMFVKGKGEMQTYWVRKSSRLIKSNSSNPESGMGTLDEEAESDESSERAKEEGDDFLDIEEMDKNDRLVEWNVEVLASLLEQIVGSRGGGVNQIQTLSEAEKGIGMGGRTVLEEFTPIIKLKRFDVEELKLRGGLTSMTIGDEVKSQLRNYISSISEMYPDNAFHNFEHASHVTASVKKLLSRIVNIDDGNGLGAGNPSDGVDLVDLAGHSYGITSDPLTQFAVVFSAIIHDVDHPGVSNMQLVKENTRWAQIYKKSIAEQKSVDIAWNMLMSEEYSALRASIYHTEEDLQRFRQLVVNTVMATDIVDRELQALRKARWETAFHNVDPTEESLDDGAESEDCKATIVIEHLIQASDVSHTMQHWYVYKKWNERFFMECYGAFVAGRADVDPSKNWYKEEIGFFDHYVIPLAKKLQSCGVFGVSSHEYLNYAVANREEWVREGDSLVQQYISTFREQNNPSLGPPPERAIFTP
eukprot:scaffold4870_cov135-Cylindrotheca_fusiformis.AAC.3